MSRQRTQVPKHQRFRSNNPAPAPANPTPADQLPWREVPPERLGGKTLEMLLNERNGYLRVYALGECSVIVTREDDRWHMSIAHPRRYPTWDEVATARYRAIPANTWMAMMLPPPERYVNVHSNCFQLVETAESTD
jgi:hypothetical protein